MANKGSHRGEYTTTALWQRTKKQAKLVAGVLDQSMVQVMDAAINEYSIKHGVQVRSEEAQADE